MVTRLRGQARALGSAQRGAARLWPVRGSATGMSRVVLAGGIAALVCTAVLAAEPAAPGGDVPYGIWVDPVSGLRMQIAPCGYDPDRLCGAFLGEVQVTALTDLQAVGDGRWIGGQGRDPSDGRVYASRLLLGIGMLQIDYCRGVFCRSMRLQRPDGD